MAGTQHKPLDQDVMYCINHPHTETLIRCSRCLDPICPKCAVRTPVGLRCRKCTSIGRSPLYQPGAQHLGGTLIVALPLSLVAGAIMAQVGLLFTFLLAIPLGGVIGEAVIRATRRRGRHLQIITGVCIAIGAMIGPWLWSAIMAGSWSALPTNPLAYLASLLNISTILYAGLAIGAAIARLR